MHHAYNYMKHLNVHLQCSQAKPRATHGAGGRGAAHDGDGMVLNGVGKGIVKPEKIQFF